MIFTVTLDRDEDGAWVVECPSIPGCFSQGDTREEAIENIKDAIKICLEVRAERGMPLTVETSQVVVAIVREQPELMELLARRSAPGATFALDQARADLWLDRT